MYLAMNVTPHATTSSGMCLIWTAVYKDGSVLSYDGTNSSEDIDRANLLRFILHDQTGKVVLIQDFKPGQCLIYRRRTEMSANMVSKVIHIVGWFIADNPEIRHVAFVAEHDRIVKMGDFNAGALQHLIELLPTDMVAVS